MLDAYNRYKETADADLTLKQSPGPLDKFDMGVLLDVGPAHIQHRTAQEYFAQAMGADHVGQFMDVSEVSPEKREQLERLGLDKYVGAEHNLAKDLNAGACGATEAIAALVVKEADDWFRAEMPTGMWDSLSPHQRADLAATYYNFGKEKIRENRDANHNEDYLPKPTPESVLGAANTQILSNLNRAVSDNVLDSLSKTIGPLIDKIGDAVNQRQDQSPQDISDLQEALQNLAAAQTQAEALAALGALEELAAGMNDEARRQPQPRRARPMKPPTCGAALAMHRIAAVAPRAGAVIRAAMNLARETANTAANTGAAVAPTRAITATAMRVSVRRTPTHTAARATMRLLPET